MTSGTQRPDFGFKWIFCAISSPLLPHCQGYIAPRRPSRARHAARLRQPPVAVLEQVAGDLGQAQVEHGEDVEVVPHREAAVGLAVQAARPEGDVHVEGVRRRRLEEVEEVEAGDLQDVGSSGSSRLERAQM